MASTLKMVYKMDAGANVTHSMDDPKEDLTANDVKTAMTFAIDNKMVVNGDATATAIDDCYIYTTDRQELE